MVRISSKSARHRSIRTVTSFWRERSGAVMLYVAFALPVLLGVAGLAVDVGFWYQSKRVAQSAADAGAIAGALEIMRINQDPDQPPVTQSDILNIALASGEDNGFDPGQGDTIQVHYPPNSGDYSGAGDAVEVIVQQPAHTYLSGILFHNDASVGARAVAVVDVNDTCIWGLNPTAKNTIKVSGGAQVNLPCGILSNSNDPDESLGVDGGSCVHATKIKTAGGSDGTCIHPNALEHVNQVKDPFRNTEPPTYGGCDVTSNIKVQNGDALVLDAEAHGGQLVICGKIDVTGGTLDFTPGEYILDGAAVNFSGGEVNGTDVSFYITEDSGQGDSISISADSVVDLSAPWDGPNPGVLFYQDRDSPDNIAHSITGGANMNLEGILYFPNATLKFAGGTTIDPVTTLIIADTIEFSGHTEVGDFDGSSISANPNLITVKLVE
jgi:Putative Flp pilus-assembly TadE/G-like